MKKKPPVSEFLHVKVGADLSKRIADRAAAEERSVSQIARRAMEAYLSQPVPR